MYPKTMILVVLLCAASAQADVTVTQWNLATQVREPQVLGFVPKLYSVANRRYR